MQALRLQRAQFMSHVRLLGIFDGSRNNCCSSILVLSLHIPYTYYIIQPEVSSQQLCGFLNTSTLQQDESVCQFVRFTKPVCVISEGARSGGGHKRGSVLVNHKPLDSH